MKRVAMDYFIFNIDESVHARQCAVFLIFNNDVECLALARTGYLTFFKYYRPVLIINIIVSQLVMLGYKQAKLISYIQAWHF